MDTPPSPPRSQDHTTTGPARAPRGRRVPYLVGGGLALILAVAFLRPHHGGMTSHKHGANGNQPVAVATIGRGDMPVILTELGTVVPITNVTVQSRIDGYLTQVLFTEGQHVHKGDLLALIDTRPYDVLLAQYEGQLEQDVAQLRAAQVDNARYQRLIQQNSVAAMTAKDQQYKVEQLEGTVKADQALVDNEKLQITYCHILAPVDGRVGIRAVDMGNYITAGQTNGLVILTQMQPISVIFTLPENDIGPVADRLRQGTPLAVEAWDSANLNRIATGQASVLDSQIDTSTGTVRMRAIFANSQEELFPNQFVNARMLVSTDHDALLVPTNALQTGPNGQFVYVVKADDTVEVRNVKTGHANNTMTVLTDGVKEGERVVTDGVDHLRDGVKVSIPAAEAPGHAAADHGKTGQAG
ncbi:efflux RND transporter periplasmic adaptor subunit [Komagataeibacter rhaeticus]|uniref:efflux RND transporter periplasmic adaptor subunit n=1 Tax=Komagataeibacter rhaeticus TaxID=215221 RepID=UPI00054FB3A6|nr:efflux RND transporter periplasmic adaptor subunit [Komagataeibacter rhaeticus]MBL7239987.1 efflux RND transporter periplasmic adaptor subunit [Komagataeibacter rhaeticus]PYD54634.1 efflux RND transporter periplasmic adaptor subunit [Komagataeibacter rhaeticus]GBQ15998.1 multidrug efflux pump acriflavin resistance protein AcrB/AcrD/AcrF [Komagataeibacter rhaeticus DSM 16663]